MKTSGLRLLTILTVALVLQATALAQPGNRQKLFDNYPSDILLNNETFDQVMHARGGQELTLMLGAELQFRGTVISNEIRYANLQTVLIKSPLFEDAILSLSRITENNQVTYSGRILHPTARDGYMIRKDAAGLYRLKKIDADTVLQDCGF